MRRLILAAVAAASIGCAVAISPGGVASAAPASCPSTRAFVVGGAGSPTAGIYNPLAPSEVAVSYPANIAPFTGPGASMDQSNAIGTANLVAAVRSFRAQCPSSRIVLSGHSQGALVVRYASQQLADQNIQVVNYGDPADATGVESVLPTFWPGMTLDDPQVPSNVPVTDYVEENDGIANAPNLLSNPVGFVNGAIGYVSGSHQDYNFDPSNAPVGAGEIVIEKDPLVPGADNAPSVSSSPSLRDLNQVTQPVLSNPGVQQALLNAQYAINSIHIPGIN